MVVTVNRGSAPQRILAQLSGIQQTPSLVIAYCCDPRLASLIFREARHLNMLNGDWVWLAMEQAVGRWTSTATDAGEPVVTADWPLGLLGLVSQQPIRLTKHTMKGSLAILHSAIRASLAVHQLPDWLSSWNDSLVTGHSTNVTSSNHRLRIQTAKKLDRYTHRHTYRNMANKIDGSAGLVHYHYRMIMDTLPYCRTPTLPDY